MPKYPGLIKSKLPKVGTTIFTVMSRLAQEHNAINLSQGFPDFGSDEVLHNLVSTAMKNGHNQYAPMPGLLELRERIAIKTEQLYGAIYHPAKEITVTAGATQAIYTAITSVIHEDDEVVIFTPAYDCYEPAIEVNGGKPVIVQMHAPDYKIDWTHVRKLLNPKTKMIIINTPHNPTATVFTKDDFLALEKLIANTDIMVLSDEVYEHIVFDEHKHYSASMFPKLAERSFIISSFGKTFHNTGWKMGYCIAPEALMNEFRKVHQYVVFSVNTPVQHALTEYLKNENNYLKLNAFYQQKRDFFTSVIQNSKFEIIPSSGTYFQLLNYKNISDEKDTDFAVRLTVENKLATITISVFYNQQIDEKILRFCFAKDEKTLEKAAEIINKIV